MDPHRLTLLVLNDLFAVCRLDRDAPVPSWMSGAEFVSVTRTPEELSVVCPEAAVPAGVRAERGWRCLRVAGRLDLHLVGVLVALTAPLANAGVGVFAVSTYDTDYLLLRAQDLERASDVLRRHGHTVS
jgi:hypothetical protein